MADAIARSAVVGVAAKVRACSVARREAREALALAKLAILVVQAALVAAAAMTRIVEEVEAGAAAGRQPAAAAAVGAYGSVRVGRVHVGRVHGDGGPNLGRCVPPCVHRGAWEERELAVVAAGNDREQEHRGEAEFHGATSAFASTRAVPSGYFAR